MKKVILTALVIVLQAGIASASSAVGPITQVGTTSAGSAFVFFSGSSMSGSHPQCASQTSNVFGFDSTTVAGQSILRMLFAAKLAGAAVTVYGNGTCNVDGVYEDVASVYFSSP